MSKLKQIYEGWKNLIFEDKEIEKMALKRAKICAKCPNAIQDKWFDIVDKKNVELSGMSCEKCYCPLATLTRSPDKKCPINKF